MKPFIIHFLIVGFLATGNLYAQTRAVSPNPVVHNAAAKQLPDSLRLVVFPVSSGGYGYDIYLHGHLRIHQPNIPCINGNHPFSAKADAQKLGMLVMQKIRSGQMLPAVSMQELLDLKLVIR